MRASIPPRQAAGSALWHTATGQSTVNRGSVATGALQRALKSTGSAFCIGLLAQAATAPRRYGHVHLSPSTVLHGQAVLLRSRLCKWVAQQYIACSTRPMRVHGCTPTCGMLCRMPQGQAWPQQQQQRCRSIPVRISSKEWRPCVYYGAAPVTNRL